MKFLIFISLLTSHLSFSQSQTKNIFSYTNTNVLEIFTNQKSSYSNKPEKVNSGFGLEISSFHGVFIFKFISVSVGLGFAINVNENFKALPIVGDLKLYAKPYGQDALYVLLNTGRNLRLAGFYSGQSSKFGIGYSFGDESNFQYIIEAYSKSKEYTINSTTNYNYQIFGYGLAIGLKF